MIIILTVTVSYDNIYDLFIIHKFYRSYLILLFVHPCQPTNQPTNQPTMDVYDQLVDLIVQCIDSILGIFHLHIVPFVKYCYVEVDKSYMWKWFVTLASKYGHFALENATPSDIGAVVITFLVVMIFFIYGKRILCFVYKRKGSKQEHKVEQYRQCEADIRKLVDETNCNPIFLRLAVRLSTTTLHCTVCLPLSNSVLIYACLMSVL